MRTPGELTSAELSKCYELSSAILDLKDCLPDRLTMILETFRANLLLERADRAQIETVARHRARLAGDGTADVSATP